MKSFTGYSQYESILSGANFEDFKTLKTMIVQVKDDDAGESSVEVQMVLVKDGCSRKILHITCKRVQGLVIKEFGPSNIQISGLECIDHRKSQREDISWQIHDYEEGKINFYCSDIVILGAS